LAKALAAKMLPRVWAPPEHVRQLRSLTAHRRRLVRDRAAAKNRLHSILRRYHLHAPAGDPFSQKNEKWWLELDIPQVAQLRVGVTRRKVMPLGLKRQKVVPDKWHQEVE
jgi:transposase